MSEKLKHVVMIDRIKRLFRINEKNVEIIVGGLIIDRGVKEVVEVSDMVIPGAAGDESFLGGIQEGLKGGRDGHHDPTGNNPIEGVGNREGAGVIWEKEPFLGEKKEQTIIEALRGRIPFRERVKKCPQQCGSRPRGRPGKPQKGHHQGPRKRCWCH